MNEYQKNRYVLPLGRIVTEALTARIRGNILYLYTDDEPLGHTTTETPLVQRTIDDYVD